MTISTKLKQLILGVSIICSSPVIGQEYYDLMNQEGVKFKTVQEAAERYFGDVTPEGISKATGEKVSGYKSYKRWEHYAQKHLKADGTIETKKEIATAIQSTKVMEGYAAKTNAAQTIAASNWTELGPLVLVTGPATSYGIGRLTAVYVSDDEQTIYVTTPGGGLWKSTNGANSWSPLGDNFTDMSLWSVTVDPNNSSIVYVGNSSGQLLKSTNGGASFSTIFDEDGHIKDILINPNNSDEIFVTSITSGLYKTTNGGSSWTNVISDPIEDVIYKPGSTSTVYASGDDFYRSTNSGASWTKITSGIIDSDRMRIAVSPDNSNYVYVIQANGVTFGQLYRSTDSGVNFSIRSDYDDNNLTGSQAYRNMVIAVNPNDVDEVHTGGVDLKVSVDGGVTFELETRSVDRQALPYVHADMQAIEYSNGTMYVPCDGGLFKSTDDGVNWTDISAGLGVHQFYSIASTPANKNLIIGGGQDNGLTVTSGTAYDWTQWYGLDGMTTMIDPNNSDVFYGMTQRGELRKTYDGGASKSTAFVQPPENGAGNWETPMGMDPDNSNIIYAGYADLYRHDNGAISGDWINCSSDFTFDNEIDLIEMCPSNSNVIYVTTILSMYRSSNIKAASPSWTELSLPIPSMRINALSVDPDDEDRVVIVSTDGDVLESTNGGSSWTAIDAGLPNTAIRAVVLDRSENNGIYIGFEGSVYFKSDVVTSWTNFSTNLPNTLTTDLDLLYADDGTNRIRVATYGRGAWESPMYDDSIAGENTSLAVDTNGAESLEVVNVLIYPNPISKQMQVQLPTQGETVVLSIIDLNGRIINENKFDTHSGLNLLKVNTESLSEGAYLLKILKGEIKITKKIVIQK